MFEQDSASVGEMYAGMQKVAGLTTTEMRVVKEGGGHNYDRYKKFEAELSGLMGYP